MKVRIKFTKLGSLRYIGHLDFMRAIQKIIRRSDVQAAFTKGYSPHLILSFAAPLGVGLEGTGEYFDLEVAYRDPFPLDKQDFQRLETIGLQNDELPYPPHMEEICGMLNREAPEGVLFTACRRVSENKSKAMALVAKADYTVFIEDGFLPETDFAPVLHDFMEKESVVVHKVSKKTESDVDIRPMIYELSADPADLTFTACVLRAQTEKEKQVAEEAAGRIRQAGYKRSVFMSLMTGSAANLKPETVFQAVCMQNGVEYDPFAIRIVRHELYAEDGRTLEMLGSRF